MKKSYFTTKMEYDKIILKIVYGFWDLISVIGLCVITLFPLLMIQEAFLNDRIYGHIIVFGIFYYITFFRILKEWKE